MRVIVVVPSAASADPAARELSEEVRRHLGREPAFVWGGDPHLRPPAPGPGGWLEAGSHWFATNRDEADDGIAAGIARVAAHPRLVGLVHGLAAVARTGDATGAVLFLDAGRAVLRATFDVPAEAIGTIDRRVPAVDGAAPSVADLAAHGPHGIAALSMPTRLAAAVGRRLLDAGPDGPPGQLLAAALAGLRVQGLPGEVLGWLAPGDGVPAILDTEHVDPDEPWRVTFDGPPRVRWSERPDLVGSVRAPVEPDVLRLPGGVPVDGTMRRLVAAQLRTELGGGGAPATPDPWAAPAAFIRWLATAANPWDPAIGRYWFRLWHARQDLRAAYPDPAGDDLAAFRAWADRRHEWEPHAPLLPPVVGSTTPWRDDGRAAGGIDIVGYFGTEVSLATVGERIRASLGAVDIPCRTIDFRRSGSPRREGVVTDDALAHDTVVIVANADQVPALMAEQGGVLAGRRLVAFWAWDVEHVPEDVAHRTRYFDQIWVLTDFTARSLGAATATTVRALPLPMTEPVPSGASRVDLGLPADRPVVLVTFDHLSLTERKNPVGAIDAFRRAFPRPTDGGPVLVVKSMNADRRWVEHERVRLAAAGRPDIVVVDRVLSKPDQMALIAHADVLLALHRSEGLGLHLAEAMWLGTPTIATRYSGNLSFMTDDNSLLVDAQLVPAERTEGFFPAAARWADPDLDQAADHLRRLLADAALRARLVHAGRQRMEQLPSFAETGRTIAAWCGIEVR